MEELKQLQKIGSEINKLEDQLNKLPESDNKYNRKQRRQQQRKMIQGEKAHQKQIEQKANTIVTRKEFVSLFQAAQKLRDRLYYIDVLTSALEKLLLEKNIISEEELGKYIKDENEKARLFQEIQNGQKDYENRLNKCRELGIDPNISIISQQIYEDVELELDTKINLAKQYNLENLLKILESQVSNLVHN